MEKLLDEIIAEGWDVSICYTHSVGKWECYLARPEWWTDNLYAARALPSASHADRKMAIELALHNAREVMAV